MELLDFNIEKYNFLCKLEEYSRKMKLTNDYINSFNYIPDFQNFCYYCNSYNKLIHKCNLLKNKLFKINKWGCIFNTKKCWLNKLSSIESTFNLYHENIIKIFVASFKYKYSHVADEDYASHQLNTCNKLQMHLKTHIINGRYIYIQDDVHITIDNEYFI